MYSSFELILLGVVALMSKASGFSSLDFSKAGPVNSGTLGIVIFPLSFEIDLLAF